MKHRWTTLLWELWAAQALCAVAALPPGSAFHTCPALALPGLALAAAVPVLWAGWWLSKMQRDGLLTCRRSSFWSRHRGSILPPCAILSGLLPCPEKRAKQKPLCREPGTEVLFVNQKAIKRSC